MQAQVWVVGDLQDDGLLKWQADSDSQLTKVSVHHTSLKTSVVCWNARFTHMPM